MTSIRLGISELVHGNAGLEVGYINEWLTFGCLDISCDFFLDENYAAVDRSAYYADVYFPVYMLTDHLGNNHCLASGFHAGVEQFTHYYPFSGIFDGSSLVFDSCPYKYNGKEFYHQHGLDMYDYGARQYCSILPMWDRVDPLCEEYYHISPYNYGANNPVNMIDPDGREVRVAKEYQEQFRNDLQNVFGDRANMLSFNDNGTLQLDGKAKDFTKGMTKDQKEAFKGLNKAMNDKQVTSVVYADNYDITVGNEVKSVDIVQEYGGGLYSKNR